MVTSAIVVEIIAADAFDSVRLLADQRQDHRQIVRREAPQDILFAANLSEI